MRTDCRSNRAGCMHDPSCDRHRDPTRLEMVEDLQRALHGAAYARPESPSEVWQELIGEVAALRHGRRN